MSNRIRASEGTWTTGNVAGVLSKERISFPEGTVKLIRLLPQASYPRHQHPARTEWAYVLAGSPTLTVGDEVHDATTGDFVIFPTDTLHALENRGEDEALLLVGAVYHAAQ